MLYLESRDTRSDFNLALEEYLFTHLPKHESALMLWQNRRAVIVGKYQNTEEEVNRDYLLQHQIQVTRRLSGGGAVYHDLGNINYTFITESGSVPYEEMSHFCIPLLRALERVGVKAELNGRNDVTVHGRKISGCAQYSQKGRIMHHGTILYNSDLEMMEKALHSSPIKLASKGVQSVRSRVCNISEQMAHPLSIEEFWPVLRDTMTEGQTVETWTLHKADFDAVERLRQERYASWAWNWGRSPASTLKKERRVEGCGLVQALLELDQGRIRSCQFKGDFFGAGPSQELLEALQDCPLEREALEKVLAPVDVGACIHHLRREDLIDLLVQ